jgi:hypothetical protein
LCLLGASFPASASAYSSSAAYAKPRIDDPLKKQLAANDALITAIGLQVLSIAAPVVLLLLSVAVVAEKVPVVQRWMTCGHSMRWQLLDLLFRDAHFKSLGNYVRIQQTAFGAAMTVVCFLTFAATGVVLGVNNLFFSTYTGSVSPQVWFTY